MIRIVFAGTPVFAQTALLAVLNAPSDLGFEVIAVLTQPDRPSGRGLKLTHSPVKETAIQHHIPVYQPISLKLDGQYPEEALNAENILKHLAPDVMIVAAYGLLLPQWALDLPKAGCVNIHASLLPRWRGAAPIQRAIQAGDTQTGVALMAMDIGLDTGKVYAVQTCSITDSTTGGQLHDDLARLGAELLCLHLPNIVSKTLTSIPQPLEGITYAQKLCKEQGRLNFNYAAYQLCRQIRAFDPSIGCFFDSYYQLYLNKNNDNNNDNQPLSIKTLKSETPMIYKVWGAASISVKDYQIQCSKLNINNNNININIDIHQIPFEILNPGTIINVSELGLDIVCGDIKHNTQSILRITDIQKQGGKRLPIKVCWQQLVF